MSLLTFYSVLFYRSTCFAHLPNILGKSSRKLLENVIAEKELTPEQVSEMIHGSMRKNLDTIMLSIEGLTTPLQRKLIASTIDHIDDMTKRITDIDDLIKGYIQNY